MNAGELRALTNLAPASSDVIFTIGGKKYLLVGHAVTHPRKLDDQKKEISDGPPVLTLKLARDPK